MLHYLKIILIAAAISLVGSLPLGALNMTAFQITLTGSISGAMLFALAAISIEVIYVGISFSKFLQFNKKWSAWLVPVLAIVLILLGFDTMTSSDENVTKLSATVIMFPFFAGLTMSALNPMQIPFWSLWNNLLKERKILGNNKFDKSFFLTGIAIGSALSFAIFILLALKFKSTFTKYMGDTNSIIGLLYIIIAIVLAIRIIKLYKKNQLTLS